MLLQCNDVFLSSVFAKTVKMDESDDTCNRKDADTESSN